MKTLHITFFVVGIVASVLFIYYAYKQDKRAEQTV